MLFLLIFSAGCHFGAGDGVTLHLFISQKENILLEPFYGVKSSVKLNKQKELEKNRQGYSLSLSLQSQHVDAETKAEPARG